jgi:predicted nucleotidyltransferase
VTTEARRTARAGLDERSAGQVAAVVRNVRDVLGDGALAAYLHGSAVHGGLRPDSDLDVLVVAARPTTVEERRVLIERLLPISGRRAIGGPARSIELTILAESDVRPWHYPPRIDLQYGDWWRAAFEAGDHEPWTNPNPDVAVLVSTVLLGARTLFGPPPGELLDPVPREDLVRAMVDGIPDLLADLDDDTRNVLLTLARMLVTIETGDIRPKDAAADHVVDRLPPEERPALVHARAIYVGEAAEDWSDLQALVRPVAERLVGEIRRAAGEGGHGR